MGDMDSLDTFAHIKQNIESEFNKSMMSIRVLSSSQHLSAGERQRLLKLIDEKVLDMHTEIQKLI